jgi:hypothetical protein
LNYNIDSVNIYGCFLNLVFTQMFQIERQVNDMKWKIILYSALGFLSTGVMTAKAEQGAAGSYAPSSQTQYAVSAKEAYDIAYDAYVYFYPLVTMGVTRQQTDALPGDPPNTLANRFYHIRQFPPADFRAVVRMNFDTLYSSAWLDLTRGPMILSVPDTGGRYYVMEMLDMWTDVFAAPGSRTTGNGAGNFAVVPPGWSGNLPNGVTRIDAPTPYVWVCGRTKTNGPKDYEAVNKIQDGYTITPLSQWGDVLPQAPLPANIILRAAPVEQVEAMPAPAYFEYAADLMKVNPPHVTDWSILAKLRRIGIEPGQSYDPKTLDPVILDALNQASADARRAIRAKFLTLAPVVNGWQMNVETIGVYGNSYLKRAVVAENLLAANQPDDAVYPMIVRDAQDNPVVGEKNYVLHFDKGELPPVDGFWSLTMYDAAGFQVANPINRFVIRDRDPLNFNADGSLDIYVQHGDPGGDRTANWLPSPSSGVLGLTLRLYAPRKSVLDGHWSPPPLR